MIIDIKETKVTITVENIQVNTYVANGGWVPSSQGLVPPTQTQVGRTRYKPALPTTQPRAPPAMPKNLRVGTARSNGGGGGGSRGQGETQPPKGPDLRHPTPSEETYKPHLLCQLTEDLGKRANWCADIELIGITRPSA